MPPPQPRFSVGTQQQNAMPYHQQFASHSQQQQQQQHPAPHAPSLNPPPYLAHNMFGGGGGGAGHMLSLAAGLNTVGGFGAGDTGLASQAARMGFAQAGALPHHPAQHGQHQAHALGEHGSRTQSKGRIREVWKHNLLEEMANLRNLVDRYPYIAMVGFPCCGRVAWCRPPPLDEKVLTRV